MTGDAQLVDYYAKRAQEYERIYEKPERQSDLASLRKLCAETFTSRKVLEIACGTGYWTQVISQTAESITAIDINEEVLQIARAKTYGCGIRFHQGDVFGLKPASQNGFTAGLAVAWWSHLRKSQIDDFLRHFHELFPPGALLVFIDNKFVAGSNTPISRTDDEGNTYQIRKLDDGSAHEVLKNFPDEHEVRSRIGNSASEICWTELTYYWVLAYKLSG